MRFVKNDYFCSNKKAIKMRDVDYVEEQDVAVMEMPCLRTREEMMEVSCERMRNIVAGGEQTLSHNDVMRMVDNAIAQAV